ncbi:MAG: sugar phosphate isomerase/epimerase family protein, partial [Pirellulales bacterium]
MPTRREMLGQTLTAAGAVTLLSTTETAGAAEAPAAEPFGYALNTSTIRGQKLPIVAEIDIVARAGYQGIEPWVNEIDAHQQAGGTRAELRKRAADQGLSVVGLIGFAEWIVDDDARRAKGLEEARRIMDMAAEIGATCLAAPPAGYSERDDASLDTIAERYRVLLELGEKHGIVPVLELWGFARVLNKLSDVAYVAVATGHPQAAILADSYHLYKGGSSYDSVRLISGVGYGGFHINDYPAEPPRAEITDAHRVFPGDGAAPLDVLFRGLRDAGYRGMLSLEVFNREYWNQDALYVARSGLEKTREAVRRA